ncbi:MAG: UDP-N-acetylmuramate dehydrogenase [Acidobacteriota bacterium]
MPDATFAGRWAARLGPDRWRANAPLAALTTFRVGGPAQWLVDIRSVAELEAIVADATRSGVAVSLLGGGSNVLVADAGVVGLVVRLHLTSIHQPAPDLVRADAGVTINGLVRWTIGRGLAALEAWAGTPGTVGGAIYGNAHWGGRNIGDLVTTAQVMTRDGHSAVAAGTALGFAYDMSRLQRTGEILIWAEFRVSKAEPGELRAVARESLHYRKSTQPLATPSAGCIFQNPGAGDAVPAGIPRSAGALVDRAGLKGHRVGGARISDHHANFIVNDGGATAADIRALIELARTAVRTQFGVALRDEIVCLGF